MPVRHRAPTAAAYAANPGRPVKPEDQGPALPAMGPTVERWRRLSAKRPLTHAEAGEYGRAVLAAIGRARANATRAPATHPHPCISGLAYDAPGSAILAAVRQRQARALERARADEAGFERNSAAGVRARYEQAMREKAGAPAAPIGPGTACPTTYAEVGSRGLTHVKGAPGRQAKATRLATPPVEAPAMTRKRTPDLRPARTRALFWQAYADALTAQTCTTTADAYPLAQAAALQVRAMVEAVGWHTAPLSTRAWGCVARAYGVRCTPDAMAALYATLAPEPADAPDAAGFAPTPTPKA